MEIEEYGFTGPIFDTDELPAYEIGVYVVLCVVDDDPHCVLDIGTTGEGSGSDVTATKNFQHRLKTHDRRTCWQREVHGTIGYCVRPISNDDKRNAVETELQWRFDPPCGTFPWEAEVTEWDDHEEFRNKYGPRGAGSL